MTHNFTKLGYLDSCSQRNLKRLTGETLEKLMTSESVNNIMSQIEAVEDKEKKAQLKKELPLVLFACRMPEDGVRPKNETAIPSGFCIHDWDKLSFDPATYYRENVSGREEEHSIVFAHVTPRGEGLRLVTTMKDGESIRECQQRMAKLFGMEQYADPKIKDIVRGSFLPSKKYLLYLNEKVLFEHEEQEMPQPVIEETTSTPKRARTESNPVAAQTTNMAESISYEGVKYSLIIEALLKRIATQGYPHEGERNTDLFTLVRELRHICEYNFNTVYMLVQPYFNTLPDAEIRRTVSSAIATNGRTMTQVMRGVLDELKNLTITVSANEEVLKLTKLPKVSDIEEMILSKYPKHLRSHVYLASLPIWGTYATHLRFDFMDGRENSPSFLVSVVGKSGSGKAFAAHLFNQMTKRFRIEDAQERRKADEYLAICNKTADSSDKPEDPRPKVRLYGDDITTSQLLDYLSNLNGEHGLQFTEEVARLQKAKCTIYGDNDDLYCKAFDNAVGGKESKSKQTRNIRIPIFLNTLFCGTPGAMHKFYNNPEGGLNNRVIFIFMPNVRMKGFPHYGNFTQEEQQQFDEVTERLWNAGTDGKKLCLPWLEKAVTLIKNKWDKEDEENPDDVWYDLGKRALITAFRAGILEYELRGCPTDDKSHREIVRVVKWVAETVRQGVYAFSGKDYEQIAETDNAYQQQVAARMSKNKKLFSLLPERFSIQDVINLRVKNGDSANVYMVLSRWMQDGVILSSSKGHYCKVDPLSA